MSQKRSKTRRKKKTKVSAGRSGKSRKEEFYTPGELFLAGLGAVLLVIAAGVIITSILK